MAALIKQLNNDKHDCCCDKDSGAGGRKKGGKKGKVASPELTIELNLTTTYVNDKSHVIISDHYWIT
eukprot:7859577-Ditylum_brightwellii.AAC.1